MSEKKLTHYNYRGEKYDPKTPEELAELEMIVNEMKDDIKGLTLEEQIDTLIKEKAGRKARNARYIRAFAEIQKQSVEQIDDHIDRDTLGNIWNFPDKNIDVILAAYRDHLAAGCEVCKNKMKTPLRYRRERIEEPDYFDSLY